MTTKLNFSQFVDLVLAQLYSIEEEVGPGRFLDLNKIASNIKRDIPKQWVFDAGKVMEARGLVQCIFEIGGGCFAELTGEGRMFVEEERGTGIISSYHANPENFVNVQGSNNQIVIGDQNKTSQVYDVHQQRDPAFKLIDEIEKILTTDSSLSDEERSDLKRDVQAIRGQLEKKEPNRGVLAALLDGMSKVSSIVQQIAHLVQLINL